MAQPSPKIEKEPTHKGRQPCKRVVHVLTVAHISVKSLISILTSSPCGSLVVVSSICFQIKSQMKRSSADSVGMSTNRLLLFERTEVIRMALQQRYTVQKLGVIDPDKGSTKHHQAIGGK